MRHDDHGHTVVRQVAHDAQDVAHELRVERRGGLVKEHHVRIHRQSTGDGHALLLATRKLTRHKIDALGQTDLSELLDGDLLGLFLAALEHLLLRKHDVLFDRQVREQVELLKDHAQVRAHLIEVDALGAHIHALNDNRAARRML